MNDPLGERIKEQYENRTRYFLPRRTFTILRLDGKSFHTYTRGLDRPFDKGLITDIDAAIIAMLPHLQGAVLAYTQSDEISILLTDFRTPNTSAWFDGNLQKMVSVSSSIITAEFNRQRTIRLVEYNREEGDVIFSENIKKATLAYFDSRTFTIPDRVEVMNYFRWRQQDCIRNSVSMVAQSKFSHKELNSKSQSDMHEMLHGIGVNWATDFTDGEKNGRIFLKEEYRLDNLCGEVNLTDGKPAEPILRTRWTSKGAWVFTKDEGKLLNMIPDYEK